MPASAQMRQRLSPGWLNTQGDVVHPDAPRGGGGPGLFARSGPLGADGEAELLPHPDAPAAGALDPVRLDDAQSRQAQAASKKLAPRVTADSTLTIKGMEVTLGKDTSGESGLKAAYTEIVSSKPKVDASKPPGKDAQWQFTVAPLKVKIWTEYGQFDPESLAAYGRGTTDEDRKDGNVTLGFYESCHRADLLAYLQNNDPPVFTGRGDFSVAQVQEAIQAYTRAVKAYFDQAKVETKAHVDEVGKPTLSEYKAANP
jgi:hypothetical protein